MDKIKTPLIRLLADRVLVKPIEAETTTKGGIIIPDNAQEKPRQGRVILVGPGEPGQVMQVKEGDHVLYGEYSGQQVHLEGEDYLLMRELDIFVIINPE
jgi:chaperonin GroES